VGPDTGPGPGPGPLQGRRPAQWPPEGRGPRQDHDRTGTQTADQHGHNRPLERGTHATDTLDTKHHILFSIIY